MKKNFKNSRSLKKEIKIIVNRNLLHISTWNWSYYFKASFLPNEFTIFCIWSKSWISTSLGLSLQTSPAVCQVVPAVNLAFHSILKLAKYCKEKKLQDILPKTHKSVQEFLENNFSDICILLILECNCAFSKRTVFVTPCLAKWYKVWHPRLPPPTKIE